MMRGSNQVGRSGLLVVLVCVASSSGWAALAPKKAPDEARQREAEALTEKYERLYGEGNYSEATEVAERACSILEEHGKSSIELAECLNDLGVLVHAQGDHGKAEPLLERSLAIRQKALGHDHPDVAGSLNNLAALYQDQGDYGKAEPLLERALTIFEKALGHDHLDIAYILNNLAALYQDQGDYGKAEPLYERALAVREKALGHDHPLVAQSLNNLANLYQNRGDYGKAEPLYERALAIWETAFGSPEHPDVAYGLHNLAALYKDQGDYGKAEPLYERALAIRETALGPDHPLVALSLNSLALLCYGQGDYGKAEPLLGRALAIREKELGPEHPDVANGLNNLASLYKDQGDYGKAEPLFKRAMAIWEKAFGPDHPLVAKSLNNLALLYQLQGDYGKAEPPYERALAILERAFGPEHPDVAASLNNLASLYQAQGDYVEAEPRFERALAIWEKAFGPDHPVVALSLENLATLHEDQSRYERALPLLRGALNIEETNLVRTLTVASESRRLAFASTISISLYHVLSLHLRVAPEHHTIAELALTTLLRCKNRVQDLVAQSNAALRRSLPQDDLHLLDDLSSVDSRLAVLSIRGPGPRGVDAHAQQIAELHEQRDRLWSELAKHSALVESLERPITIEDVQQALPADSALVEFVQYVPGHNEAGTRLRKHDPKPPPRYAAYLVFPDRDFAWVDLGLAAPIDEHVQAFRKAVETRQAIPTELYDAVMRPIAAKLGSSTHRLVLAPAGDLSLIPFGALFDGHHYLVEQYDLRYVTTGRDLLPPPATPPVATTPVTIVANPTGDDVPGAELEADFLASFFPRAHVLWGDQATETNVRTIERPLVLHLATHGFFGQARNERDNPMFRSGLNLADSARVEVDSDLDDGQLTAYEVSGMDLRGTQLVVLSACDTGLGAAAKPEGKVLFSEGVFGLRRAFATAGVRTTVMSLWEVSGVATQNTMETYYRKLAEGMGRGEAMQAVQLEMLRTEEFRHPKDWAAFIVSGDDGPMVFPEGEGPRVPDPGPPEIEPDDKKGLRCAMAESPDRPDCHLTILMGLLGLVAVRRRAR